MPAHAEQHHVDTIDEEIRMMLFFRRVMKRVWGANKEDAEKGAGDVRLGCYKVGADDWAPLDDLEKLGLDP